VNSFDAFAQVGGFLKLKWSVFQLTKTDLQSRNFVSYDIMYKNGMAKELYTMPSDKLIFKVVVWVGDNPGLRLTMEASNADEVTEYLHEKYGPDIVFSIWNEEAANKPR
jgi:hypothetical protein